MCFQEYIAYQCGHRSLGVVRPCPLTTTGHNFPVCAIQPAKQYFAETMCPACERQLHSRWVLIREWEHRWLHERGACGCDVCFPGLLTTPRVIGTDAATDGTPTATSSTLVADDQDSEYRNSSTPTVTGPNEEHAEHSPNGTGNRSTTAAGGGRVPALFSEAVTPSGEHHVAIRLSSLYAAEWLADHRALHAAGRCSCNADFRPFQPQIPEEDLTPADKDVMRRWHQLEAETEPAEPRVQDSDDHYDENSRRMAEIKEIFGSFTVGGDAPRVSLPPPTLPTAGNQGAEVNSIQDKGRRGHRHDRPNAFQNQTRRRVQSHSRFRSQAPNPVPTQSQSALKLQPTAAPYNPGPIAAAQQPYHHAGYQFSTVTAGGGQTALVPYPLDPDQAIYQQQATYVQPAYPYYATAATYTDTIPLGAHPWTAQPQVVPGAPGLTRGPGPYRAPGISHNAPPAIVHSQTQGQGQGQPHQQQVLAAPEQPGPVGICGLPIGAGPEGAEPQMPSWRTCRLRSLRDDESRGRGRSSTLSSMRYYSASEGGGAEDRDGEDRDGGDEDEPPPSPTMTTTTAAGRPKLRRRNSAST